MKKTIVLIAVATISFNFLSAQIEHKVLSNKITHEAKVGTNTKPEDRNQIDVDGDGINETFMSHFNYPSFSIWNLNFNESDTANPGVEFHCDKQLGISPIGSPYIKEMTKDDKLSADLTDWESNYPLLGDVYYPNLLSRGEVMIAFRLKKGSDYHYGWMKLEVSGSSDYMISISEYAYDKTANVEVKVGQTTGGGKPDVTSLVESGSQKLIGMYPNPATDILTITNGTNQEVKVRLLDITGKELIVTTSSLERTELNVSELEAGTYLLEIDNNEERFLEKLFVK